MRPFIAYIRMQLNVNYGISALKYRFTREKRKIWEPILIAAAIVISIVPLLVLYTLMMSGIFAAGVALGQPEIILTIAFLFAQLVILFFGLFYILGTFYFSQDIESLIPLPLKPYEVIGGKFMVIMVNEYLTALPLLLPPLIIYGVGMGQGMLYWLKSIMLMLITPALPLSVAALLIMVLMRFINLRRHKDVFAIIGGLAAIFIGIGVNIVIQNSFQNGSTDHIQALLEKQSGLIELIGRRFPPSIWATKGLYLGGGSGFAYFILFIAVCTLLFLLLLWLSNRLFYKALLAGQEVSRKKKKLTDIQSMKEYSKETNPVSAIMKREWKLLLRTPVYALNGLTASIVGPLMIIIMLFAKNNNEETMQLFDVINNPKTAPYVLLGGLGLMLFTAGMNVVASTSLSREGNTFWISKMIPVSAKQQVTGKLVISILISAIGVVITGLIMWLFFNQPLLWVLGAFVVGVLGSVPMAALSLLLDVFHPKLIWNSEQEAMKQNINSGIGLLLSLLILLVLGIVVFVMLISQMPMWLVFFTLGVASVILGVLSILALFAVAERKYKELEA